MIVPPLMGRRIERPSVQMRIVDEFLKCVGFVAEVVASDLEADTFDHVATGFYVYIPIPEIPGANFQYFVTAKHVVTGLAGRQCAVLANKKSGGVGAIYLPKENELWFYHPTDPHADVAVIPLPFDKEFDVKSVPLSMFLRQETVANRGVGIGDEVFAVGLFSYVPGTTVNQPIVRYGTVAMLPEEEIYVQSGFTQAHLVELRSIGGLSGSPVFVRETRSLPLDDGSHLSGVGIYYLMGLMHGHWDVVETEMNASRFSKASPRGVNMGIGIVVPASKILETINSPAAIETRRQGLKIHLESIKPTAD